MLTNLNADNPDEELVLSELIREGGDPQVDRSPTHIASVEQAILAKLQPQHLSAKKYSLSSWSIPVKLLLALAAGFVLAIWVGQGGTDIGVRQAWAQVVETIRGKPWVHGVLGGPDDKSVEIWMSPVQKTAATRIRGTVVSFSDYREGVLREYNPDEKVISLRPIDETDSAAFRLLSDVFEMISEGQDLAQLKRAEVVEQTSHEAKEGDNVWTEFEFTLRRRPGQWDTTRLVFRVDPSTRLPQSLSIVHTSQANPAQPNATTADQPAPVIQRFVLDYPASGPADIYALGVPKDAKIVDCGASADVQKLVKAIEAGRPKFDHYTAIVVPNFSVEHWWECWNGFYRVYRKGDRWRVEQCFPYTSATPERLRAEGGPVDDVDHAQWWLAEANKRFCFPMEVCDGKAVYQYDFAKGTDNGHGDLMPVLTAPPQVQPISPSLAEFSWSNIMPDLVGRFPLGIPNPHRSDRLDMHPKTGPSGTVLLETESIKAASIHGPDSDLGTSRYWIDPSRNYLVIRWENSSIKDGRETLTDASQIDKTAVTPQDRYYPLELRRENCRTAEPDPKNDQVFHFYIDFNSDVPDALFDPKSK